VCLEILKDLKREGLTTQAVDLEAKMKARADRCSSETYPFASEMAWDSTDQEEVYAWTRCFGHAAKAKVCIDAIMGYLPTVPHCGYNGCARRYWDFLNGGAKTDRLERMLHHYGSSLSAIPVLTDYRDHPDDISCCAGQLESRTRGWRMTTQNVVTSPRTSGISVHGGSLRHVVVLQPSVSGEMRGTLGA